MIFTDGELKDMINERVVGNSYPYDTSDSKEIEQYIFSLLKSFNSSELVNCYGIFNHYWSGYASFVDIFCYKKDDFSVTEEYTERFNGKKYFNLKGLVIYISRLAPVAIIGVDNRSYFVQKPMSISDEKARSFLQPQDVLTIASGFMQEEFEELKNSLREAGFVLLSIEYLEGILSFHADHKTFLKGSGEPYRVFDAIFHWCD